MMLSVSLKPRVLSRLLGTMSYVQGQSPSPKTREYFYYVDHQGQVRRHLTNTDYRVIYILFVHFQLFLDDTKVKNFITCFKGEFTVVFLITAPLLLK